MKQHLSFLTNVARSNFGGIHPYKLNFAVTYRCNHKCLNCNIWKLKPKDELTFEEIDKFFANYQFNWINLTGGELFMRPDIEQIFESIVKHNKNLYYLTMTTNALLSNRVVEIIKKVATYNIPNLMVTTSIDGIPEVHNEVRGLHVAFQQGISTFTQLREIPGVKAQVGYTILPENVGKMQQFVEYMQENYAPFSPNDMHVNTYNMSSHYYGNNTDKLLHADYKEKARKELVYFLSHYRKGFDYRNMGERMFQNLEMEHMETGKTPLPCKSLATSVFLDPNGYVYPCIMWSQKAGNIRDVEYKLSNLFQTEKYQELLSLVQQGKCPNCWTVCEGTQTMLGNLTNTKVIKAMFT